MYERARGRATRDRELPRLIPFKEGANRRGYLGNHLWIGAEVEVHSAEVVLEERHFQGMAPCPTLDFEFERRFLVQIDLPGPLSHRLHLRLSKSAVEKLGNPPQEGAHVGG